LSQLLAVRRLRKEPSDLIQGPNALRSLVVVAKATPPRIAAEPISTGSLCFDSRPFSAFERRWSLPIDDNCNKFGGWGRWMTI
jgi:hypothetical protein